jgi:hypothetical protein
VKSLTVVLLALGLSLALHAQCTAPDDSPASVFTSCSPADAKALASTSDPDAASLKPESSEPLLLEQARPRRIPTQTEKRLWLGLTFAQHGAATFDAWSTRRAIASGRGYERDPLTKPFANSGAIYASSQVGPLGLDLLSRRLMRSNNAVLRRLWWLPQTSATAASIWCGVRNLHIAGR